MSEQRKFQRLNQRIKLNVSSLAEGDALGQTRNVSSNGICFVYPTVIDEGASISVKMTLPISSSPIDLTGRVKWCVKKKGNYEIGLELYDVHAEYKTWLTDLIVHGLTHQDELDSSPNSEKPRFLVSEDTTE